MSISTSPDLSGLSRRDCPKSVEGLEDVILSCGYTDPARGFERLEEAMRLSGSFLEHTLDFIRDEALRARELLPRIPLLKDAGALSLTQRQCLCILANAFFCTFSDRRSDNCISGPEIPSINFDELYGGYGRGHVETAKLRMLFNYFERCRKRRIDGDSLSRPLRVIRNRKGTLTTNDWEECAKVLIAPVMHPLGHSIDDAKGMLQIDFANRIIGGGCIAYGCVQEEILFCICPELIASRLFCPAMKADEAIILIGAEQFSKARGYAGSLDFGGNHIDTTPLREDGVLASYIAAIDALDFRYTDSEEQYAKEMILRELDKAMAGFTVEGTPNQIATGNWGCGAFGGDAELKSVIQWLAACRAGKTMHYYPHRNETVHSVFPTLVRGLTDRQVTVGELAGFLFHRLGRGKVYARLENHFLQ